jgi:hypothetical protein
LAVKSGSDEPLEPWSGALTKGSGALTLIEIFNTLDYPNGHIAEYNLNLDDNTLVYILIHIEHDTTLHNRYSIHDMRNYIV